MLKQSYTSKRDSYHTMHLYDKVKQDLFEEHQPPNQKIPSITTIFLLQIQAYIIQILTQLPSSIKQQPTHYTLTSSIRGLIQQKKLHAINYFSTVVIQSLRWSLLILLVLLDNVARFLNVEQEMADLTKPKNKKQNTTNDNKRMSEHRLIRPQILDDDDEEEEEEEEDNDGDRYIPSFANNTSENMLSGTSEPSSPTKRTLVSPSSPINSPTPNFVVRKTKTPSVHSTPPPLPSPRTTPLPGIQINDELNMPRTRVGHIRSLSNNMVDQRKPMSPQKLRRITAQREITVQNAILPIVPKKTNHHHHHNHKRSAVASSVASRSSSESSTTTKETHDRPRMHKTMSLSTAQQYQNELNSAKSLVSSPSSRRLDPLNGVALLAQQQRPHQPPQQRPQLINNAQQPPPWKF